MRTEYTGGPPSRMDRMRSWLAPRGGSVSDGGRLAAINFAGLLLSLAIVSIMSLLGRLIDRSLPLPYWLTISAVALILIAVGLFTWYRYAVAHGRAARASGRGVRPDVFGAIAAVPFVVIALFMISTSLFGLFLSVLTFSGSRAVDAIQRLGVAVIFLVLAAANVIIARSASD